MAILSDFNPDIVLGEMLESKIVKINENNENHPA